MHGAWFHCSTLIQSQAKRSGIYNLSNINRCVSVFFSVETKFKAYRSYGLNIRKKCEKFEICLEVHYSDKFNVFNDCSAD